MSKAYTAVIDMIAEGNIDYKKIALALAKKHPTMFLEFAGKKKSDPIAYLDSRHAPDWMYKKSFQSDLIQIGPGLEKVRVIKALRAASGMGLYEAKAFAEVDYFSNSGMNTANISITDAVTFSRFFKMLLGK